jgi:hypothetical protein
VRGGTCKRGGSHSRSFLKKKRRRGCSPDERVESQARDSQQNAAAPSAKRTTRHRACRAVPLSAAAAVRAPATFPARLPRSKRRALHSVVALSQEHCLGNIPRELHNGGADSEAPMRDRRGRAGLQEVQVTGAGTRRLESFRFSRPRRRGCFFPQGFAVSSTTFVLADQGSRTLGAIGLESCLVRDMDTEMMRRRGNEPWCFVRGIMKWFVRGVCERSS